MLESQTELDLLCAEIFLEGRSLALTHIVSYQISSRQLNRASLYILKQLLAHSCAVTQYHSLSIFLVLALHDQVYLS